MSYQTIEGGTVTDEPTKIVADCGRTCRFYSSHTETMDPGVPGSQQTFAECDPPLPEGMTLDEFEKTIEAAGDTGRPCPFWVPVLISGACAGCGKTFRDVPVTELYGAVGELEVEFVCSPVCVAFVEAKGDREVEAVVAEDDGRHDDADRIRARVIYPSPCCGKESKIVNSITMRCGQCGQEWRR